MKRFSPEVLGKTRPYTRSKAPWRLDAYKEAKGETSKGVKFGWRLVHYLSGGGMKVFGRTIKQEEADLKRTRFLIAAGIFAVIWFIIWI
jgi:hypothetical protein